MSKKEYSVDIVSASRELSHKEKVMLKDTTAAIKIDKATQCEALIIDVDYYAELRIYNEASDDKEYSNYVVVDKDGTRYVTGSQSFYSALSLIWDDMGDSQEEWALKVYRRPSVKREGKEFITCTVV